MTEIRPDYYRGSDGKDLFDRFEAGLLSPEETIGFYKANAIKYLTREADKNGEEDLDKALTYIGRLKQFKYPKNVDTTTDETRGNYNFDNDRYRKHQELVAQAWLDGYQVEAQHDTRTD